MKNENLIWRYNKETGRPMYCRFSSYFCSTLAVFIGAFAADIIDSLCINKEVITSRILFSHLFHAGMISIRFFVILYIIMSITGWYLRAEGDFFTKHIYSAIVRWQVTKSIKVIPKRSQADSNHIGSMISPGCILICEHITMKNGVIRRAPMILNAASVFMGKAIFEARNVQNMFTDDYIFNNTTAENVIWIFNRIRCSKETRDIVRNCDGLAVIEFSIVYDETILKENKTADNLIRIQTRSVPCTADLHGKLVYMERSAEKNHAGSMDSCKSTRG